MTCSRYDLVALIVLSTAVIALTGSAQAQDAQAEPLETELMELGPLETELMQAELIMPDRFDTLDTDANGAVNFAEFSAFAKTQGVPRTRAAQSFIRLASGDSLISQADFLYGVDVQESPNWARGYDTVSGFDLSGDYYGEIIDITPNEEVAGEVIRTFEFEVEANEILAEWL